MSNINNLTETYINIANQNIASSASAFLNNLEDIKLISSIDQKSEIEKCLATIDECYEKIINIYRPNIRSFVSKNIRTIAAAEKIAQEQNDNSTPLFIA